MTSYEPGSAASPGVTASSLSTLSREEANIRLMCESTPSMMWLSGADKTCTYINQRLLNFIGQTLARDLHQAWIDSIHPDDRDTVFGDYSAAFDSRSDFRLEYRLRRADGTYRWMVDSGIPRYTNGGEFAGYIGSCMDVTPVKEAEAAIRRSEERYSLATAAGGVGVWDFDLDSGDIYVDPHLKAVLGYEDDEIRNHIDDWGALVHPDDQPAVMQAVDDYLAGKTPTYEIEHRMLHKDGSVRWFLARGCAMHDERGRAVRMVGTDTNITKRKRVEARLDESNRKIRRLAGQMISAQEEERSRIARELHDSLNQRLAAVSIELGFLRQQITYDQLVDEQLSALQTRVQEIAESIRQMSHELHSPALEHLGLSVALRSHCAAFEEHHGIATTLNHHPIPEDLDGQISLCLYRLAQESLRNVARHSDARNVWVNLRNVGEELVLTVADDGVGFDVERIGHSKGLGLVSMQERARLVGAAFSVSSGNGLGTRVEVRVPMGAA